MVHTSRALSIALAGVPLASASCQARAPVRGKAVAFSEPYKTDSFKILFDCDQMGDRMTLHAHINQGVSVGAQVAQLAWDASTSSMAATVNHTFGVNDPGYHSVRGSVCASDSNCDTVVGDFDVNVNVRYVRRSLQALSDEDQQKLFSAWRRIKDLRGDEGREIYGPSYLSFDEITAIHYRASMGQTGNQANPDVNGGLGQFCDQAHFTPSFPPFHMWLVMLLEKSLQFVDPSLTVPYWNPEHEMRGVANSAESSLWDIIGPMHGAPEDNYQITTGPFANWEIPSGEYAAELAGGKRFTNPWGKLMAPFNLNENKYVSRFAGATEGHHHLWPLPTATYADNNMRAKDFSATQAGPEKMNGFVKFAVHTVPHISMGGYKGGVAMDALIEAAHDKVYTMSEEDEARMSEGTALMAPHEPECQDCRHKVWNAYIATIPTIFTEIAFAEGCLECPSDTCSEGQTSADVECTCTWKHGGTRVSPCNLTRSVEEYMAWSKMSADAGTVNSELEDLIRHALTDSEDPDKNPLMGMAIGTIADNVASAQDPLFWLHHSNVDRVFMSSMTYHRESQYDPNWRNVDDVDAKWYDPRNLTADGIHWPNADSAENCKGYAYHDLCSGGQFINLMIGDDRTDRHTTLGHLHSDGYTNAEGVNAVYEDRLPYCYDDLTAMAGLNHDGPKYAPEQMGSAMACDGMDMGMPVIMV
jgi:hypothetical protein